MQLSQTRSPMFPIGTGRRPKPVRYITVLQDWSLAVCDRHRNSSMLGRTAIVAENKELKLGFRAWLFSVALSGCLAKMRQVRQPAGCIPDRFANGCASGEMADTPDLGSGPARGGGSNPLSRTILDVRKLGRFATMSCCEVRPAKKPIKTGRNRRVQKKKTKRFCALSGGSIQFFELFVRFQEVIPRTRFCPVFPRCL
jgi:hypothetical protein